jgi:hypothetical protein
LRDRGGRCTVRALPHDREVSMNEGELTGFLTKLSEDTELQQAYVADPGGTMRAAGLPEETIGTILSRDLAKLKALLPGGGYIIFMVLTEPPS